MVGWGGRSTTMKKDRIKERKSERTKEERKEKERGRVKNLHNNQQGHNYTWPKMKEHK